MWNSSTREDACRQEESTGDLIQLHVWRPFFNLVNDDQRRIRYVNAGWPGSTHDDRVLRNTVLVSDKENYFQPWQYLLGDSAYSPQNYMIPAFKKISGGQLSREEELFNTMLSTPRVESEHCIGMLKGRFPFLRSIRFKIDGKKPKKSLRHILRYVKCCCILHNMLIDEDVEEYDDDDKSLIDADNILNRPLPGHLPRHALREELKNYLLARFCV